MNEASDDVAQDSGSSSPVLTVNRLRLKLALLVGLAFVMCILVLSHVDGVNGPSYWRWPWRRMDGWRFYFGMMLAGVPFFAAVALHARRRIGTAGAIALMAGSTFALQLVAVSMETRPMSLDALSGIVTHPYCTSYFTEAVNLMDRDGGVRSWLADYPKLIPTFFLHAKTKPPGITLLYYAFLKLFGLTREATIAAGVTIALLAACVVPATYGMLRFLTADRAIAFAGAAFIALCPGLILVVPQFDQVYPLFTCALVVLWGLALQRDQAALSAGFGLVLAINFFFAWNLSVLGIFFVAQAVMHVLDDRRNGMTRVIKHAAIALAMLTAAYLLFHAATGFNAIAAFRSARATHAIMLARIDAVGMGRHLPQTIPFDLTDFAMSAGWIGAFLAICGLISRSDAPRSRKLAWIAMAQIAIVALTGLLQGETFRVWLFLLPLLMLPIGLELRRWPVGPRVTAYACLWLVTAIIGQNMLFNAWLDPVSAL